MLRQTVSEHTAKFCGGGETEREREGERLPNSAGIESKTTEWDKGTPQREAEVEEVGKKARFKQRPLWLATVVPWPPSCAFPSMWE